jgi:predicted lipoprotein with Yx(FWY)xxD motif
MTRRAVCHPAPAQGVTIARGGRLGRYAVHRSTLTRIALPVAIAALALVGAKVGDDWTPIASGQAVVGKGSPVGSKEASAGRAERTKVHLKRTRFGRVLFDSDGYALYVFTRDGRRSKCNGDCAVAWPPLRARGKLVGGKGVKDGLLGRVGRRDGSKQVTYDGQPLYNYIDDPLGVVLCQDVREFGGTWYAVKRSGEPVR